MCDLGFAAPADELGPKPRLDTESTRSADSRFDSEMNASVCSWEGAAEAQHRRRCRWADVNPSDSEDEEEAEWADNLASWSQVVGSGTRCGGRRNNEDAGAAAVGVFDAAALATTEPPPLPPPPETRQTSPEANSVTQLQLNPFSPEFIPTLTMACPVVGVCCLLPAEGPAGGELFPQLPVEQASGAPNRRRTALDEQGAIFAGFASVASITAGAAVACPALSLDAAASYAAGFMGRRRGRAAMHRQRPADLDAQSVFGGAASGSTRVAGNIGVATDGCSIVGARGATSAVGSQAVAGRAVPAVDHNLPEATEEQWEHRAAMRGRALEIGKATQEYRWYADQKREENEPPTPDPTDRTISKRHWKYCLQQWRRNFTQRYMEDALCCSVISTEEWQSSSGTTAGGTAMSGECDDASVSLSNAS